VRSHIMMGVGMAPRDDAGKRAVLVWEGYAGSFFIVDERFEVTEEIPVLTHVGNRYAFLFALADPTFPDRRTRPRHADAGKLMALASFAEPGEADAAIRDTVDRILTHPRWQEAPKHEFRDSPVYNAGVESEVHKVAAALLSERIFEIYSEAAVEHIPAAMPLHISGGCGLNCDWNFMWRELGHFSSVFVPPCANDAGTSIGHAIDALHFHTGDPYIDWDVYAGREFDWDRDPDPAVWRRRALDEREVASAIGAGQVFAWVQGRWEIGPRALGNRSILAEPFKQETRDRLNEIKMREDYRPIAPVCRVEDLGLVFDQTFEDPYMLYFRTVSSDRFAAITHVDGSARCQTVTEASNAPLHRLLSAFAEQTGYGVLCNTSLNFKGRGFINNMSDLIRYCEETGFDSMVVGDAWFERVRE
jgi:hydroxymethyl cephem carbamoyltransferase